MLDINKVYNVDCIEGMKRLENKTVNTIVTSPPYNLGGDFHTFSNGKRVTYGDYKGFKDKLDEETYQSWQLDVLDECYRVLKDDGVMFYNHKNRIVKGTTISPNEWISKSKFNVNQIVIMNLKSTANVDKRRFFPVYELIYVLTKEKGLKLNNEQCLTDVWEVKKVPRKVSGHPATFHEEVPTRCILASSKEGDVILDPFMGSGTTAIASLKNGRQYIGFEVSEEYIDIANKRINTYMEESLINN